MSLDKRLARLEQRDLGQEQSRMLLKLTDDELHELERLLRCEDQQPARAYWALMVEKHG